MSFNFDKVQGQQLEPKKGKFIRPGVQTLILKDITLEESQNTGNLRPVFFMETEPITDKGWEGFEGAKGQIGKVSGNFGFYLKDKAQQDDFIAFLKSIMIAVGSWDKFAENEGQKDFDGLKEAVNAVKPYLTGTSARYLVCAEQYHKLDNSGVGLKLKFPTRKAVESLNTPLEDSKLPKYDETNPSHFKRIQNTERKPQTANDNLGLPFD